MLVEAVLLLAAASGQSATCAPYRAGQAELLSGNRAFQAKNYIPAYRHYARGLKLIHTLYGMSSDPRVINDDTGLVEGLALYSRIHHNYKDAAENEASTLRGRLGIIRSTGRCGG